MIFLTVGTLFSFDRLVKAVDVAAGQGCFDEEEIWAQIGPSAYKPTNFKKAVKYLDKKIFDEWMMEASKVISHAGMGIITSALDNRKPLLVMPRTKHFKEHVNNHQVAIAKKFEYLGYFVVAYGEEDMQNKIEILKDFIPIQREAQPEAVIERISGYLQQIQGEN